jgi:hypothetical protein
MAIEEGSKYRCTSMFSYKRIIHGELNIQNFGITTGKARIILTV